MATRGLKYTDVDYARKAIAVTTREALLEPTKLQRKMEKKANSHRKKEKREVKGQRKEKVTVMPGYVTVHSAKTLDDKKCFQPEAHECYSQKLEHEASQLEKSDITNEHEPSTCAENNSYLSDGTQSSQKRKRPLIIRIKLRKHSGPSATLACSPSGRADVLPRESTEVAPAPIQPSAETKVELERVAVKFDQESPCSAPDGIELVGPKRIGSAPFKDRTRSEDSMHATLIDNWIPPPRQFALDDDCDEEWLFGTKQQNRGGSKRHKADIEVSCAKSCRSWPRAQLLPEAGVYALPFTGLF